MLTQLARSVFVCLVFSAGVAAQVVGSLEGVVKDASGAIIPGAVISISPDSNPTHGIVRETSESGFLCSTERPVRRSTRCLSELPENPEQFSV